MRSSAYLFIFFFFFFYLSVNTKGVSYSFMVGFDVGSCLGVDEGFSVLLDFTSCSFICVVLYVSGCVILFAGFYMSHDPFLGRFVGLVMIFVFSMIIMVLFPSLLFMMVGWDGLGVSSFLLVVYYMKPDCLSAGMVTFMTNRIGDAFLIVSISMMSLNISFNSCDVFALKHSCSPSVLGALGLAITLGSMTKSAVVPFSAWLPEAMAAPTPVSSLVHSSTLVTAGVYVMMRFGDATSVWCNLVLMLCSIMTFMVAGTSALSLVDVKKVVALSTLSQVSFMMFCVSMGAVGVAFFHLLVHAFFKALMFLCVGSVIFYSGGVQDGRYLGALWSKMPLVFSMLVVSNFSLMGFPYLSGYYSKELIMSSFLTGNYPVMEFFMVYSGLALTSLYSCRMLWLMCVQTESVSVKTYKSENLYLNCSLLLMSWGSVMGGKLIQSLMVETNHCGFMSNLFFYKILGLSVLWVMNISLVLWVAEISFGKSFVLEFISCLGFLKPLSGAVVSSVLLSFFCKLMASVDMGLIRSFAWKNGLKKSFVLGSNYIRSVNFGEVGLLLFSGVLVWVVICLNNVVY